VYGGERSGPYTFQFP